MSCEPVSVRFLTLNIGAASRARAQAIFEWLRRRDDDVVLITETSGGEGTRHLLDRYREAGYAVRFQPSANGDRGSALVSRVGVKRWVGKELGGVTLPHRVVGAVLETVPRLTVIGVYVPSRDRSAGKIRKKSAFVRSLLAALQGLPSSTRRDLVLAGDYNVISRLHRPLHRGFLPFEFRFLDTLEARGFRDAFDLVSPGIQEYSWVGRTDDGYRYDYFHVTDGLRGAVRDCRYLHETRTRALSDHAAMSLELSVAAARFRPTGDVDLLAGVGGANPGQRASCTSVS